MKSKEEPQKTPQKKRVAFYFDRERYALRLRQYHKLLAFAEDVLRELKKRDIEPTTPLLRGLLQVRQEQGEMMVQNTQGNAVKLLNMYELVIRTTPEAETAWSEFVEANLSVQAKPMHNVLRKQYNEAFEDVLQTCYNIKSKFTQNGRSGIFDSLDFDVIEYDSQSKDVHLSASFLGKEKNDCMVYAESDRAESVYNSLIELADKMNELKDMLIHPTQMLDAFVWNTDTGKIELVKDFDFNTL